MRHYCRKCHIYWVHFIASPNWIDVHKTLYQKLFLKLMTDGHYIPTEIWRTTILHHLLCSVYAYDWIWLVVGRYGVLLPTRSSYNWFFLPALKKATSAWPHRHTWAQAVTRHCPFTLDIQSVLCIMIYANVGAMRYSPFEAGVAINNEKGKVRFCLLWHVCKAGVNFWEDVNAALV